MTTEEKINGLEHLLRKCPDVLTVIDAAKLTHMGKNTIHALIKEGKLITYQYQSPKQTLRALVIL